MHIFVLNMLKNKHTEKTWGFFCRTAASACAQPSDSSSLAWVLQRIQARQLFLTFFSHSFLRESALCSDIFFSSAICLSLLSLMIWDSRNRTWTVGEQADPPKSKTCFRLCTQKHTCRHGGVIDGLSSKSKFLLLRNRVQRGITAKVFFPWKCFKRWTKTEGRCHTGTGRRKPNRKRSFVILHSCRWSRYTSLWWTWALGAECAETIV